MSGFEELFNKAAVPLCFVNKDQAKLRVNSRFEAVFGYTQDEIPTLDEWWQLAYPDPTYRKTVLDTCYAELERAVETGTDIRPIEYDVTCKNGDVRSMVVFGSFIGKDLLLTFFDITERKRAEAELRTSEARYVDLYENAPDMYLSVNARTAAIEKCNQTLADKLGRPKEEIIGRPVFDIYHPAWREEAKKTFHRFVETGEIHDKEIQLQGRNGSKLDVSLNVTAVCDDDGRILHSRSILRDITERKRNESINSARLHLVHFAESHSLDELLEETLNEAEKLTDSCIGFYHFVEADQDSLTLQNWSKRTKSEFCTAEGKGMHYPIADAGVWVDCVHQGKPVIHNDYASLPHRKGMPQGHAEVIRELVVPVTRDGSVKAILGVGNKPTDYTERDVKAISLLADLAWEIAERKQAEEALTASEMELRLLVSAMTDIILVIDAEGRYLKIADSNPSLLYRPSDELLGKTLHEIFPEDQADLFLRSVKRAIDNREPVSLEYTLPIRGRGYWFDATISPMSEDKALLVARDITDRKETEAELILYRDHLEEMVRQRTSDLERAGNRAQQYLDVAGVILVALDCDQRVTLINQKGCEVLGRPAAEIVGKNWFETFLPDTIRGNVIREFRRIISGESEPVGHFENPVLTRDNGERLVAWQNVLIRDDEGNITGTLSSGEDITERRHAEEQILHLNRDLENRASLLQESNAELTAFAYSVSHDLRTPLIHINGFLELLQKRAGSALDEKCRHYMDTISDSAKRMSRLIDDLLSFSRMGRRAMSLRHVELDPLVRDVIGELEPEAAGRNIAWHIGDLPAVHGDAALLRVVLNNLISNALKFTRSRQQARIEIGSLPGRDPETVLFVRDNGVGFDMAFADNLFGVFQRLHPEDEFEGSGIGLANVRRIIARHGGRTWARGEPDQGAAFYLALPQTPYGGGDG